MRTGEPPNISDELNRKTADAAVWAVGGYEKGELSRPQRDAALTALYVATAGLIAKELQVALAAELPEVHMFTDAEVKESEMLMELDEVKRQLGIVTARFHEVRIQLDEANKKMGLMGGVIQALLRKLQNGKSQ